MHVLTSLEECKNKYQTSSSTEEQKANERDSKEINTNKGSKKKKKSLQLTNFQESDSLKGKNRRILK